MKKRMVIVKSGMSLAAAVAAALSTSIAVGADAPPYQLHGVGAIDGSGKNAIDGSGKNAIDGSGKNAIDGSGKNAIDGSGKNAIDGSGKNAIDGSGKNAIDGSGKNAIDGSGKNAIDGSGKNAIDGSGKNAIDGSGKNAIDGSGKNAIDGSGKNAIDGSGKNAIDGSGKNAIDGSGKNAIDPVFQTVLVGPVETVDRSRDTIRVLGQDVLVLQSTLVTGGSYQDLNVGDYVSVAGLTYDLGVLGATIEISEELYAPGASHVSVSGTVSAVDYDTGKITVGGLEIDVNETDLGVFGVNAGDYVALDGTQPAAGGKMLAD